MSKFNYFKKVTITNTAFTTSPDANFGFNASGLSLLNRGSIVVEYSFDGENVHGDLNPSDPSVGVTFDQRAENKVWLRLAIAGSAEVRIEAWGTR